MENHRLVGEGGRVGYRYGRSFSASGPASRACKAAGVPHFSPHHLRHRRISLWHRHGMSWAEIGSWVGQRSLSVTADTYTHVLADDREADRGALV